MYNYVFRNRKRLALIYWKDDMKDETESLRREMCDGFNSNPDLKKIIEDNGEETWDSDALQSEFEVKSFAAPFIHVRRKSDGVFGTMMFQHSPRFYWNFLPDKDEGFDLYNYLQDRGI